AQAPHARIRSVDTGAAGRLPGVVAVLTGADLPIRFGILPVSQDEAALEDHKVRYVGDPVAAVAAVDEETAAAACELIKVEYQLLKPVMSIEQALREASDEPIQESFSRRKDNIHRLVAYEFGDLEAGFAAKTDPSAQEIVVSKLAMVTGRPVKCTLTREEVFYAHRGRHPTLMWYRTGVTRDGRITAMHLRTALDGGAYGSYGAASVFYTGTLQTVTYAIPAYKFEGVRVYTNKAPCGPKRGHGTPQGRFGIELHLDKIAEELGLDAVEVKRRNFVKPFSRAVNWLRITSCGLEECTDKV